MTNNHYPIVIIGGSIAAISFIRTLRSQENTEPILLIYGEDRLPYKRTKINKNMVRGFDKEEFALADEDWYKANNIHIVNAWATKLTPSSKEIILHTGATYTYNKLLLATGNVSATPRINGVESVDFHKVQNAADVDRLLHECKEKQRFLIIGGGVEGIETADQLVRKGKDVVIAGRMTYPMQKLFTPDVMATLVETMSQRGVEVHSGVSVASIKKTGESYVTSIKGIEYTFDALVSCAGAVPNIVLAKDAGLKTARGIVVNEWMQTSDSSIFAAGDVAEHANGVITGLWHAAEHQGALAAINLYQHKESHSLPPYRLKTEVFGHFFFSAGFEKVIPGKTNQVTQQEGNIVRHLFFEEDRLIAVIMQDDGERAKAYQQALFEQWPKEKVLKEIPLPKPLSFAFKPTF